MGCGDIVHPASASDADFPHSLGRGDNNRPTATVQADHIVVEYLPLNYSGQSAVVSAQWTGPSFFFQPV